MDLATLKSKLVRNNVPPGQYSLYEGLKPDAWMLWEIHGSWEVYYMDEKGNQFEQDRFLFATEEAACDFLWNKMDETAR